MDTTVTRTCEAAKLQTVAGERGGQGMDEELKRKINISMYIFVSGSIDR